MVQTLRYIVTSVVGLGVSVLLISWGHPLAWLRQTRGTSAYQTWYYGNTLSDRVCSVADLHWPGAAVFCLAAALAFASVFLSAAANALLCWRPGALP